jgi:hypothetical protein
VIRAGFAEVMTFGAGIRLTSTSPVVAGEPVLTVEIPDETAATYAMSFRPGEYIIPPAVLDAFPVREDPGTLVRNRVRLG